MTSAPTTRKVLRVLLVAVASLGIAAGAAACGPGSHPHHKKTTVNGY